MLLNIPESGNLFCWGCNDSGEVNPNEPSRVFYEPRHVLLPAKIGRIVDACTGDQFSHIVTGKINNMVVVKL